MVKRVVVKSGTLVKKVARRLGALPGTRAFHVGVIHGLPLLLLLHVLHVLHVLHGTRQSFKVL